MPTFTNITVNEFKKAAGQFFRNSENLETMSLDSVTNGHKCIALMYLGHSDDWSDLDVHEAIIILELAGKRLTEFELKFIEEQEGNDD